MPENKPRYLMGVGTPDYLFEAVEAEVIWLTVFFNKICKKWNCNDFKGKTRYKKC